MQTFIIYIIAIAALGALGLLAAALIKSAHHGKKFFIGNIRTDADLVLTGGHEFKVNKIEYDLNGNVKKIDGIINYQNEWLKASWTGSGLIMQVDKLFNYGFVSNEFAQQFTMRLIKTVEL